MARKAPKFYVVWKGHHSGIFDSWDACKVQVQNVQGAQFKSFSSFEEAKDAFKRPYKASIGKNVKKLRELSEVERLKIGHPNMKSIAVDCCR